MLEFLCIVIIIIFCNGNTYKSPFICGCNINIKNWFFQDYTIDYSFNHTIIFLQNQNIIWTYEGHLSR